MKSITFQRLRRYEPSCKTKPSAIIFSAASKQKIPMKYISVFSYQKRRIRQMNDTFLLVQTNDLANVVLSSCGKCSSSAKTMQLAMIVNSTIYSNGLEQRERENM